MSKSSVLIPTLVDFENPIIQISAGTHHSLVLTSCGDIYSCGDDYYGQLGRTVDHKNNCILQEISDLTSVGIRQISAGHNHSLALTVDGRVFAWGNGKDGQLGYGYGNDYSIPSLIKYFTEKNICIRYIKAGGDKSICLSISDELYAFGNGSFIIGAMTIRPILCNAWKLPKNITEIDIGFHHLSILTGKYRHVISDISQLLRDNLYWDIEFRVENKRILAHKVILLCRSKEFNSLFLSSNCNGRENIVEINDFSYSCFLLVIQYCYTERAVICYENASEILKIASSLKLYVLVQLCENVLAGNAVFNVNLLGSGCCDAFYHPKEYFSDVTLILEGFENSPFYCHKVILAARCDYFKTMFESSFLESTSNEIILHTNVNDRIFRNVLKYIYMGIVDDNVRNETDICTILSLSNEYHLIELTRFCIELLISVCFMFFLFSL